MVSFLLISCSNNEKNKEYLEPDIKMSHVDINQVIEDDLVNNYKDHTDYSYSWDVVNIDLEAKEISVNLQESFEETSMYSFSWNLEPKIIKVKKWDLLKINFKNSMPESTSIHWHWIRLKHAMDWVAWNSQKPIKSWESFIYEMAMNDVWTYWFHSHLDGHSQTWKWLYGVILVEDNHEYGFEKDEVLVLKDYRLNKDWSLNDDFDNMHDFTHGGRFWNYYTINNQTNYTYSLWKWETIRLRLVNASNARDYNLNFSWVNASVFAVDWGPINKPYKAGILTIAPWERYELAVSLPIWVNEYKVLDNNKYLALKLVRDVSKSIDNTVVFPKTNIQDFTVLENQAPDKVISLDWTNVMWGDKFDRLWWLSASAWTINWDKFPEWNNLTFEKWKLYKIRFENKTKRPHPMHLHWDFFQVISVNWKTPDFIWWKDTVNVLPKGYVDVAIIPTNPWNWMFHCHILEHAEHWMMKIAEIK